MKEGARMPNRRKVRAPMETKQNMRCRSLDHDFCTSFGIRMMKKQEA